MVKKPQEKVKISKKEIIGYITELSDHFNIKLDEILLDIEKKNFEDGTLTIVVFNTIVQFATAIIYAEAEETGRPLFETMRSFILTLIGDFQLRHPDMKKDVDKDLEILERTRYAKRSNLTH